MGKPVWVTEGGNLGTIEEDVFYELEMEAFDPDGGTLEYQVIAGYMPPGLVMNEFDGTISGRPKIIYEIRGVPLSVDEDVTSTFCCRITSSTTGQIADRTFSITVTGQDAPVILTTSESLGTVSTGTYFSKTIDAIDLDGEPLTYTITSGRLPTGLTLDSSTGEISGYAFPVPTSADIATVGWSAEEQGWSEYPWDHAESWTDENYQFTVEVTDGKEYAQRTYTILVVSQSTHDPVITSSAADLGVFEHDNYFAFKFEGIDFDSDEIEFGLAGAFGFDDSWGGGFDSSFFDQGDVSIPPGITLNAETGWLYGYISTQSVAIIEYNFSVYAYKKNNPSSRSDPVSFKITVVNELAGSIIWQTPADLGSIATGSISELSIKTSNTVGLPVNYELINNSVLPAGLRLLNNGLIVGRPIFEHTTFDNGTTTFDQNTRELGSSLDPVTFDQEYTFTVRAKSPGEEISATRTFTLNVVPSGFAPYESFYLKANPGLEDKNLFFSLTKNTDIIPPEDVYRNGDPYFGISQDIRMLLISGLNASSAEEYTQALSQNHYRKNLKFGNPQVAKAYDSNRNIIYEVIYYDLVDYDSTAQGSVSSSINLTNKINNNITILGEVRDKIVYPNSLVNMRNRLKAQIGLSSREILPQWMSNRQADGSIIGWKPVAVIAYVKPGAGDRILFNLKRRLDLDQKLISFDIDRYIWDNNLSNSYNTVSNTYDSEIVLGYEPPDQSDKYLVFQKENIWS